MSSFRTADTARIPYQDGPMVGAVQGLGFRVWGLISIYKPKLNPMRLTFNPIYNPYTL